MSRLPPALLTEKRRKILRTLGMAASALMVLTVLTVFVFIWRNESAFEDDKCPFTPIGERAFGGGKVLEEGRTCVPGISERRYRVARDGRLSYELARKRLANDRFDPNRYRWDLTSDAKGDLVLTVRVDGLIASEFREADAVRP